MKHAHIVSAIDIGTHSVKMIVADIQDGKINILAKGSQPHFVGVRKGEVYNPQKVAQNIALLKEKIEASSGVKIKKAVVSVGGGHLFSLKSQGIVSVSRADQKISREDIQRVLQACQAVNLPPNKEILEVIPQEYIIDHEQGIRDPLGLQGIRLEARSLLVCVFSPVVENLERAVLTSDIEIEDIVPSVLAFPEAVLTEEQKELGVAVVDIGSATTSVAIFSEGVLRDFAVFPVGSSNITTDIAVCLRCDIRTAEFIKNEYATLKKTRFKKGRGSKKNERIEIPEKNVSFSPQTLQEIVHSRVGQIFSEATKFVKRSTKETLLPSGVVLTGGGAKLKGIVEFSRDKFDLPCYVRSPRNEELENESEFSVAYGLLKYEYLASDSRNSASSSGQFSEKLKKFFKMFLP